MSNFFDEYGLLHVEPNEDSENGILFLSELITTKIARGSLTPIDIDRVDTAISYTIEGDRSFNANPKNDVSRFSHDNMTGLYTLCFQFGLRDLLDELPVIRWNCNRRNPPTMMGWWVHPRDILYYLSLKYPATLGTILFLFLLPFILVSLMAPKRETSGKCLWFLRLAAVSNTNDPISYIAAAYLALTTFVLSLKGENWKDIFAIYFKNPNHPNNREIQKLHYDIDRED